jgi:hypothetical protein
MLLIIYEFRDNRLREGDVFLIGVNVITFRVYHENVRYFGSEKTPDSVCIQRHRVPCCYEIEYILHR